MHHEAINTGDDVSNGGLTSRTARALLCAIAILSLAGAGTSVELTRIHYLTHIDPSYESICAIDETVNCETVAQSPYSVFLGLPVSVWGLVAHLVFAALAGWGITRRRLHATWPAGLLLAAALAAAGASVTMAWISFAHIDAVCLFCTALYVLSALLVPITAILLRVLRVSPWRALAADLAALVRRPLLLLALLALAGGALGLPRALIRPWWHHPGWSDLADLPHGVDDLGRHWIGAPDPLLTIVEYSDYECAHCRRAHREMRSMAARFHEEVRLVHRNLPLDKACNEDLTRLYHLRACEFAVAAECAGEQGLFWEMNDALFSVQETVRSRNVDVDLLAARVGLDRSRFDECRSSDRPHRRIRADLAAAREAGARGVPTFVVGRQPYPGAMLEGLLIRHLDQARAGKEAAR